MEGQIGLEKTPAEYIAKMVAVFREVRRVLRSDGTCWVNMGDCYAGSGRGGNTSDTSGLEGTTESQEQARKARKARGSILPAGIHANAVEAGVVGRAWVPPPAGLKQKDLVGMPWRLAFALQADGWWLRQDIIWSKPNPMPESVLDRCTKAHEYLFLLTKSATYFYDAEAIKERCSPATHARLSQDVQAQIGSARVPGKTNGTMKAVGRTSWNGSKFEDGKNAVVHPSVGKNRKLSEPGEGTKNNHSFDAAMAIMPEFRNKRSVWEVATQPFSEAHFATFPMKLVEPCILAGCPEGGTVLDPFNGSGTTGLVALANRCNYIGIELNPEYAAMSERRLAAATAQGVLV